MDDLRSDLIHDYGETYVAILTEMVSLRRRAPCFPKPKMKALSSEADGLRFALTTMLVVDQGVSYELAYRLVASHQEQWEEA